MNSMIMDNYHISPYSLSDEEWIDCITGLFYKLEREEEYRNKNK